VCVFALYCFSHALLSDTLMTQFKLSGAFLPPLCTLAMFHQPAGSILFARDVSSRRAGDRRE